MITSLPQPTFIRAGLRPHRWLFSLSLLMLATLLANAQTRYVTPAGAGTQTGASWTNALSGTALQGTLATAPAGTTVLVAGGLYKPTSTTARTVSFSIASGVQVYGGYVAGSTTRQTSPSSTTLSGDLDGNGALDNANSYHVVTIRNTNEQTRLDGLCITLGNANGSNRDAEGGGIFSSGDVGVQLNDCQVVHNLGTLGGGFLVVNDLSQAFVVTPVLTNCRFADNQANRYGAGLYFRGLGTVEPEFTDCQFTDNQSEDSGGGIYYFIPSSTVLTLTRCRFANNTAQSTTGGGGGAMYYRQILEPASDKPTVRLTDCRFDQNKAPGSLGGALNFFSALPVVEFTNCQFTRNAAKLGGAISSVTQRFDQAPARLINCSFSQNTATGEQESLIGGGGGAIQFNAIGGANKTVTLTNCSFSQNRVLSNPADGGAIKVNQAGSSNGEVFNFTLTNCVFWQNGGEGTLVNRVIGGFTATYCLFDTSTGYSGANNGLLTQSPFVDANADNLQLTACSPAVNAGDPASTSATSGTTDAAGQARFFQNGRIDIGAFERQGALTVSLTNNGPISCTLARATLTATTASDALVRFTAPGGDTFTRSGPQAILETTVPGTFTVVATTTGGCSASATSTVISQVVSASLINNGPLTCTQTSVTLTASVSEPGVSYQFGRIGVGPLNDPGPASTFVVDQPGQYAVNVRKQDCFVQVNTTVESQISSAPPVSLTNNGPLSCAQPSVTLTASSTATGSYAFRGPSGPLTSSGSTATVSQPGTYSVTFTSSAGCPATASTTVEGNTSSPTVSVSNDGPLSCTKTSVTLSSTAPAEVSYRWSGPGSFTSSARSLTTATAGAYVLVVTAPNGCTATATTTVESQTALATPTLLTQPGQPYPGGQSAVTVTQNSPSVILEGGNCAGTLTWRTPGGTTGTGHLRVPTTQTGTFVYWATCQVGVCVSAPASATVTVTAAPVLTTLRVLHQDNDRNPTNNVIRPYLQLQNDGTSPIPYGEITLRYWLTVEQFAPLTNLSVYYAQLGTDKVRMKYVALEHPRQGAFGYIEYRFDGSAGSLGAGQNSGPIQNGIGKTDWTAFNESDDHSYADKGSYVANSRITAYRNGTLIWGQEPAEVAPVQSVKADSESKSGPSTNSISTLVQVRNEGNVPVSYPKLTVRYWFSAEGNQPLNFYLDYAQLGNPNVKGKLVKLAQPVAGADTYLELSFANVEKLYPLSSTGNIQYRIAKSDWSNFNQSDDYSYRPTGALVENPKMAVYLDGSKIYGEEPTGAGARIGAEVLEVPLEVVVLGNPVTGPQVEVEVRGAEGQPLRFTLTNVQGQTLNERGIKQAREIETQTLPLASQPAGVLLLRVSTPSQTQMVKVLQR